MSNEDEFSGLKFFWKIENFNHLKGESECLVSPSFGPQLRYELYMIFQKDTLIFQVRNVSGYLLRFSRLYFSLACLGSDGAPLNWQEEQTLNTPSYVRFCIPNKTKYFPCGTLTIDFRIWRQSGDLLRPVTCHYAHTQIESMPKFIKRFFAITTPFENDLFPPPWSLERKVVIHNDETLTIELHFDGQQFDAVVTTSLFNICVKIQVAVLDASNKSTEFASVIKESIKKNEIWKFVTNIKKSMLSCYSTKFLPSGKLTIGLTITISEKVIFNKLVEVSEFHNAIYPKATASTSPVSESGSSTDEPKAHNSTKKLMQEPKEHRRNIDATKSSLTISQTVQDMFTDGYLSDFKLKVGDRTFLVHKNILGMRSKVFRAMFDSEMKEIQDNCVDVTDFDGETIFRMLEFVYSDRLDNNIDWSEASSLYAAADFYALEPLKQGCSEIIKNGLNTTSALGVLCMANLHEDRQLKSSVLDFISLNDQDIIGTEDWIQFEKENGDLALVTLRELYLRKMNG